MNYFIKKKQKSSSYLTTLFQSTNENSFGLDLPKFNEYITLPYWDKDAKKFGVNYLPTRKLVLKSYHFEDLGFPLEYFKKQEFQQSSDKLSYICKTITPDEAQLFISSILIITLNSIRYANCVALVSSALIGSGDSYDTFEIPVEVALSGHRSGSDQKGEYFYAILFKFNKSTLRNEYFTCCILYPYEIENFKTSRRINLVNFE